MVEHDTPAEPLDSVHGRDDAAFDGKFRMFLAKDKRDFLGPNFVMALSEQGCVAAYGRDKWRGMMARLASISPQNDARQYYEHVVLTSAALNVNPDPQGRVVVPQRLREQAKLDRDLVVVGCTDYVQIWDRAQYEMFEYFLRRTREQRHSAAAELEQAADRLGSRPIVFPV